MNIHTTIRNVELQELADILQRQSTLRHDMIVGSDRLRYEHGRLVVDGYATDLTEDGVTSIDVAHDMTRHAESLLAERLGIPSRYFRRMVDDNVPLLDQNVNGWLAHEQRNLLVRTFRPDPDALDGMQAPLVRAVLSDRYRAIDNEEVLFAALAGIRDAGATIRVTGCDLSDTKMRVRVEAPEISCLAPALLDGYRSPYRPGGEPNPTVFAGFEISNSDVGAGATSIVPRFVFQVCDNGLRMTKDAIRAVHLGGRLDEGVIRWGEDTRRKELELITAKARDAVATFLDVDYMRDVIATLERDLTKGRLADPAKTLEVVSKPAGWTEDEKAGILADFIAGGDLRPSGILNAVTSFAQRVHDPDRAAMLEEGALDAAMMAASH